MITTAILQDITHGFGTKADGDGRDIQTIKTILQREGAKYTSVMVPQQCHGANVEIIENVSKPVAFIPNCDGLVTRESGVVLTVLTADCVPILYSDPVAHVIGISHRGWKGTVEQIPQKVIEAMKSLGSHVQDIRVAIGPSIGSCCYEVYGERKNAFLKQFSSNVTVERSGQTYLDLQRANTETIIEVGVLSQHIELISMCTSCSETSFFSFHRDHMIRGEMISWISF